MSNKLKILLALDAVWLYSAAALVQFTLPNWFSAPTLIISLAVLVWLTLKELSNNA